MPSTATSDDRQHHGELDGGLTRVAVATSGEARRSDALDRAVDHPVEQSGDAFRAAAGGGPGDHEQPDERRGEQHQRVLGGGLAVRRRTGRPAVGRRSRTDVGRRSGLISLTRRCCRRTNMVEQERSAMGRLLGWGSARADRGCGRAGEAWRPRARVRRSGSEVETLSDESAAISAGAIARRTNDGSVQTTSGNDSRTGSRRASASSRRRRVARASCGERFEHRTERRRRTDRRWRPGRPRPTMPAPRCSGSAGDRLAERLAAVEPVHDGARSRRARRRGGRASSRTACTGVSPAWISEDEQLDRVGDRPFDVEPARRCRTTPTGAPCGDDRTDARSAAASGRTGDGGEHGDARPTQRGSRADAVRSPRQPRRRVAASWASSTARAVGRRVRRPAPIGARPRRGQHGRASRARPMTHDHRRPDRCVASSTSRSR